MLILLLSALLCWGAETSEPLVPQVDEALLVQLMSERLAEGDEQGAADLARWLAKHGSTADIRRQARSVGGPAASQHADWRATSRLAGWQGALGAWLGGPTVALSTRRWVHPTVNLGGMLGGGALGAGAALWYAGRYELTLGKAHTIMLSQQLGMAHGAALSLGLDQWRFGIGPGLAVGAGVGTAAGYWLASRDPDEAAVAGAYSGVFWGGWLGTLAIIVAQEGDLWFEEDWQAVALYTGIADAGALSGYLLARHFGLSTDEIRMVNLGGVLGAAAGGLFILLVSAADIWWEAGPVAFVLGASSVGGAILAVHLVRKSAAAADLDLPVGSLVSGVGDDVKLGIPAPSMVPTAEGVRGSVSLVSYRF